MKCSGDKLTTELSNFVVKKFKEEYRFTNFKELTNRTDTFIFTISLPESNRLTVGIPTLLLLDVITY
jgi:hypothetical protein